MKKLTTVVTCVLLAMASNVHGDSLGTVAVSRQSGHGSSMKIHAPDLVGGTRTVAGGLFRWDITGGTSHFDNDDFVGDAAGHVLSFCIDLKENVGNLYEVENDLTQLPKAVLGGAADPTGAYPMGEAKKDAVTELWGRHFEDVFDSRTNEDAFQLALWEIVFDSWSEGGVRSVNENAGEFYLISGPTGVGARTNEWLAEIDGTWQGDSPELWGWSAPHGDANGRFQDQLVQHISHAPEPAMIVNLIGLAVIFGVMALRRRRRARG
ncbi:MAG: hypothetical protein HQ581_13800 [Planctomycetes bacterium]|nr:hypothetical protein [Planctomycetota bacterium]